MLRRAGLAALALASTLTASASGTTNSATRAVVGCETVIGQQVSGSVDGSRVVLGVVSAPPVRLQRAATADVGSWKYFTKWGMAIHSGSSVTVTVPPAWRGRVAITWGASTPIVSTLHFAACRSLGGKAQPWNAYPGGFYLDTATACVPLTFTVDRRSRTLRLRHRQSLLIGLDAIA